MSAVNSSAVKSALVAFGVTERKVERAAKALEAAQADHAANLELVKAAFEGRTVEATATEEAATTSDDEISVKIGTGNKE